MQDQQVIDVMSMRKDMGSHRTILGWLHFGSQLAGLLAICGSGGAGISAFKDLPPLAWISAFAGIAVVSTAIDKGARLGPKSAWHDVYAIRLGRLIHDVQSGNVTARQFPAALQTIREHMSRSYP